MKKEIAGLEKELLKTGDASKNEDVALQLVTKSEQFAKEFPRDSLTPVLLFKAADVAKGLGRFGKAVQLWGTVWRQYPQYEKAPMALFLQGFTFDSDLRDAPMATKYYREFLQQFPENPLAEQVKQLIAVVEQNPEDLIKSFEKKNEQ
ncbi:MAG: tol-pal system YbgF family protein [Saprospiraceae bacterium]